MKLLALSLLVFFALAFVSPAQTSIILPTAVSVVGEFNQLATPQWALGVSALYTTETQAGIGMYNTTTADIIPVLAKDPATGLNFWALSASIRQGVHEKILSTGKFRFLLGADLGPGFTSTPTGMVISPTGSFVATGLYRASSWLSIVVPIRMLYVPKIGWNPVAQAGLSFNLKALPPGK